MTNSPFTIPPALRALLEGGDGVLFLGAGIGFSARRPDGTTMPAAAKLATLLSEDVGIPPNTDLAKVAELYELEKGRPRLESRIRSLLDGYAPDDDLSWIFHFPWRAIYTTNYDHLIQTAYAAMSSPPQNPVTMVSAASAAVRLTRFDVPVYHLHGSLFNEDSPPILITEADYARYRAHRQMIFQAFARDVATGGVVYAGYSHNDPNWRSVLEEILVEIPTSPPLAFRIAPSTPEIDRRILEQRRNISTIDATLATLRAEYVRQCGVFSFDVALRATRQLRDQAESELQSANPAAAARLETSWEHIGSAVLQGAANSREFLEGMEPNWPLLAQRRYFARDIEELLFDDMLEIATAAKPRARTRVVLGPAGCGVSTLLRAVATRVAQEGAANVFVLRELARVAIGDVLFVVQNLGGFNVFVVDDAAEHAAAVRAVMNTVRAQGVRCCFLMGERRNEWGQRGNLAHSTYELGRLSNSEVPRVIAYLEAQDALGHMKELSHEERVAVISKAHEKELLVTLKEATENRSFDAIIEDEYRSIATPFGKQVYAIVAAVHQFKEGVRDAVVAKALRREWSGLFAEIGSQLDGVVEWQTFDEYRGVDIARCRHSLIANMLWARGPTRYEKGPLLRHLVNAFNLFEYADRRAFDALVLNFDVLGDETPLEDKIQFFESAVRRDPDNPYVRQHYARMFMREGNLEAALGQIESEVARSSDVSSIHHTRGLIYARLSLAAEGAALGRKRLSQMEHEFRTCIRLARRDYHPYESLARTYLDWAEQKESDEDARMAYRGRAQQVLNEGMRNADDRRHLHVVQARIDAWVDQDSAGAEHSLRRAAHLPVARQLLAKLMLDSGRLDEAAQLCKESLIQDPRDFRIAVVYAQILDRQGADFERLVAVLNPSRTYGGLSDPKHAAAFGGALQMCGDLDKATASFASCRDLMSPDEAQRVSFKPRWNAGLRLDGRIMGVKLYHCSIQTASCGVFFLSRGEMERLGLNTGTMCSFRPTFAPAGGWARDVRAR